MPPTLTAPHVARSAGRRPYDPVTFAGVSALLLGVSLLASFGPAYRVTRVDPVVALRT